MKTYLDFWIETAADLLPQALAGEPELVEALPAPLAGEAFGFTASLKADADRNSARDGDDWGRFSVLLDAAIAELPLLGEGVDQRTAWGELLRETAEAAASKLSARMGKRCSVAEFETIEELSQCSRALDLRLGERSWTLLVHDEVRPAEAVWGGDLASAREPAAGVEGGQNGVPFGPAHRAAPQGLSPEPGPGLSPGLELLLDVELEASLRFGSRELPLGEILDLGPGDVVQLDRHVADPADLIVADKIVARGEVVLVNGNFGLRITEVAVPMRRLESIRCLF